MKKHWMTSISLFLALAFLLVACVSGSSGSDNRTADSTSPPSNTGWADSFVFVDAEWIYPSDSVDAEGMNLYWQLDYFQFAADENAMLSLYVKAEKDDDGSFVFDDGQDWLLVMKTTLGNYELFPRQYIQLGKVSATVYNAWNEESSQYDITHVLVTVGQGAGYKISDFIFDHEQRAFRVELIYDAQDINFMGRSD